MGMGLRIIGLCENFQGAITEQRNTKAKNRTLEKLSFKERPKKNE